MYKLFHTFCVVALVDVTLNGRAPLSSKIFKVVVYGWVYCRMTSQKAETVGWLDDDGVHAALETDIYVFSLLKRSKLNFLFSLTGVCNIIRYQEIKLTM